MKRACMGALVKSRSGFRNRRVMYLQLASLANPAHDFSGKRSWETIPPQLTVHRPLFALCMFTRDSASDSRLSTKHRYRILLWKIEDNLIWCGIRAHCEGWNTALSPTDQGQKEYSNKSCFLTKADNHASSVFGTWVSSITLWLLECSSNSRRIAVKFKKR